MNIQRKLQKLEGKATHRGYYGDDYYFVVTISIRKAIRHEFRDKQDEDWGIIAVCWWIFPEKREAWEFDEYENTSSGCLLIWKDEDFDELVERLAKIV